MDNNYYITPNDSVGAASTPSVATVPSSVPASGGGVDIASLLPGIKEDLEKSLALSRAASAPVTQRQTGQIPGALTKQIGPAPTSAISPPRTKGEAMANAITQAGNAVSEIITAERQKKQQSLTDTTVKLYGAQQSINEAQQQKDAANAMLTNAIGDEARQYQTIITQADKTIESNKKIISSIPSKEAKAIAKGSHFDYIDTENNKTEEHAAVLEAKKKFKTIQEQREYVKQQKEARRQESMKNFGEAFAKQQPTTAVPNQFAQQQLAAFQERQKQQNEALKTWMPMIMEGNREAFEASQYQMKHKDTVNENYQNHLYRLDEVSKDQDFKLKYLAKQLAGEAVIHHQDVIDSIDKAYAFQQQASNDPDNIMKYEASAIETNNASLARNDADRTRILAALNKAPDEKTKALYKEALDGNEKERNGIIKFGESQQTYYEEKKKLVSGQKGDKDATGQPTPGAGSNSGTGSATKSKPTANYSGRGPVNVEATKAVDFFNSFLPKSLSIPRPERGELPTWGGDKSN